MKQSFLLRGLFIVVLFAFVACDNDDDEDMNSEPQNIVEYVQADPDYSILVDAVVKAELDDDLSGPGPFTLFAPDNDALQAFLDAAGTGSVEATPKETLVQVLTNHVVAGDVKSTDLSTGYFSTISATAFGSDIFADIYINTDGGVTINGTSTVTSADNSVPNGVIHEIDEVIAPSNIVDFVAADPSFSILLAALTADGLTTDFVSVLSGDGPFTVFAPTDQAFQDLLDSNDDWNGLEDIPAATLEAVLLYHVTDAGNVRESDLGTGETTVTTLSEGATFTITTDGGAKITTPTNSANIIFTDVQAQNGVVHVIDTVILP